MLLSAKIVKIVKYWKPVYDDASEAAAVAAAAAAEEAAAAAEKAAAEKAAKAKGSEGKTFTQDELNAILAKDRREHKEKNSSLLDEIEALKAKQNLTNEERENLEAKVKELRQTNMTAEQLKKEQEEKLRTDYEGKLTAALREKEDWKKLFTTTEIQRSIVDAAAAHEAYVPAQVVAILGPTTRLSEALDDEGKPTGKYTPLVSLQDVKEGKPITLELTPEDAVKRMSEMDQFLNLFKGKGAGGIGGQNRGGSGKGGKLTQAEAASKGPEFYRKWVKENPDA